METLRAQWDKRKVAEIPGHSPTLLSQHVFHRGGRRLGGKLGDIRDVWQSSCVAAGLGKMIEVERRGKKIKKYTGKLFHDFRRTGCRDMIRSGIHERGRDADKRP